MDQLPVKPIATNTYLKVVQAYILHEEIKKIALPKELKCRLSLLVAKEMASEKTLLNIIEEAAKYDVSNEEINALLLEDLRCSPIQHHKSLSYALHFALRQGEVDEAVYIDYVHQVGCSKACAVSKFLMGQRIVFARKNALSALKQRLTGQPMAKSSVAQELGVITVGLWAYPKAYVSKVWQTKR